MDTTPPFGFKELFAFVVGEIAKAVADRNGETKQQQFLRTQSATHLVMAFLPRDVIEAMLAGHCIVLHQTMLASGHDTLHGQSDAMQRATRSNLVALNKGFNDNLDRLERYQARPAEGWRDAQGAAAATVPHDVPAKGATAQRPTAQGPAPQSSMGPGGSAMRGYRPTPEAIAACRSNPEAMAALAAGDADRFARALGVNVPSEAFLAAADAPGSPFDPSTFQPPQGNSQVVGPRPIAP